MTYLTTIDDRLPRKAIQIFDQSRLLLGLTQSRYPSRVRQVIPPFSLWWVGMVYDYALWRDDPAFVQAMLPGVHAVLDGFRRFSNHEGLIESPNGWNFVDWVPGWGKGMPPEGEFGVSGIINWHWVYTLKLAAELERWIGEPEQANLYLRWGGEVASQLETHFWDDHRNLFADNLTKTSFSEHTQVLAILSNQLDDSMVQKIKKPLLADPDLHRATIYFSHYLFEAYRSLHKSNAIFDRLGLWFDLKKMGLYTTMEAPEPSRSDCHGWGAHPIYHLFTSVLGIRPVEMGFRRVVIEPQFGPLSRIQAKLIHPKGFITADLDTDGSILAGNLYLPEDVYGELRWRNQSVVLDGGKRHNIRLK